MEYVDVVDDEDNVLRQAPLDEVWEKNLLHRLVHVLIFTNTGEVMSQLRSEDKNVNPLHWTSSAAGHVASGETPLEAAERELEEELGIDTDLIFAGKFRNHDSVNDEWVYVFFGEHPGPFTISEEAEEVRGYKIDYIRENPDGMKIDPNFLLAVEFFIEKEFEDQ